MLDWPIHTNAMKCITRLLLYRMHTTVYNIFRILERHFEKTVGTLNLISSLFYDEFLFFKFLKAVYILHTIF